MAQKSENASPFPLCGTPVAPGSRARLELESAQLYTHTPLPMNIEVIHGKRPGPVLLVCAAIHGDELNGVEIIRRLSAQRSLNQLSGTLVLVPVVNLHGFIDQSRYLPDRRDLNRCFPGSPRGSLGSRVAYQFFEAIVRQCTHVIDLHTAAVHRDNLPQIRADLSVPEIRRMAEGFAIPVVMNAGLIDATLRAEAGALGIPVITYEAGEALRMSEKAIVTGVRGVMNTMRTLGMLRARSERRSRHEPFIASASRWIRASNDGLFRPLVALGDRVRKDQPIGVVTSPFSAEEELVTTSVEGIVIGQNRLPLVNEGEALFHVASFGETAAVITELAAQNSTVAQDPLFEPEHQSPG